MKNIFTPRLGLALALTSAVVPLSLAGCGGGNGGIFTNPTPTPTMQPPAGTPLPNLNFRFNNGQNVNFRNGTITPTGTVAATIIVEGTASAPLQVPAGTYPVTGTLNPTTRDFTLATTSGGNFRVVGKIPSATQDGNFTFTAANGATENGTIPRGTLVIPPPNPGNNLTGVLTYSGKSANSNFAPTSTDLGAVSQTGGIQPGGAITPKVTVTKSGALTTAADGTQILTTSFVRTNAASFGAGVSDTLKINLQFPAFTGKTFAASSTVNVFSKNAANFDGSIQTSTTTGNTFTGSSNWELASASIKINSVSADGKTINYTLSNAQFQPKPQTNGDTLNEAGRGNFNANAPTINVVTP